MTSNTPKTDPGARKGSGARIDALEKRLTELEEKCEKLGRFLQGLAELQVEVTQALTGSRTGKPARKREKK